MAMVAFDFLPMRVLPTCLFAGATYWMIGLRASLPRCAAFLALLVLTNLTGAAMNMAIGAASPKSSPKPYLTCRMSHIIDVRDRLAGLQLLVCVLCPSCGYGGMVEIREIALLMQAIPKFLPFLNNPMCCIYKSV